MTLLTMNNAGLNFNRILEEVNAQAEKKFDMDISAKKLRMGNNGNLYTLGRLGETGFNGSRMTDWALSQLCGSLEIPVKFARRIPNELLAENVNYFLDRAGDKKWHLRSYTSSEPTFGPLIRGIMSSEYTKFDDDIFLSMVQKCIGSDGDHKILMHNRDERGMHLRIGFPDLQSDIGRLQDGKPDRHMVGFHIANSEVGQKAVTVQPMVFRLVCTNGLMRWEADGDMFRQRHVHLREHEMNNRVAEAITTAIKGGDKMLEEIAAVKEISVPSPLDTIKKLATNRKYSQRLTDSITTAFHEEPGRTQFHVMQAFTRAARNLQGDDRVEVEKDASRLLKAVNE